MADNTRRYYWLKLQEGFFSDKRIKKLRRIAGGDTYTIIYLKMQLLAMKTNGILVYTGLESSFSEELALELDEDEENVSITVNYLLHCGLMETADNREYFIPDVVRNTGSEGNSARRMREYRERQASQCDAKALQCDNIVQNSDAEIEIEIEKEIEKEIDYTTSIEVVCSTDVQAIVATWNSLGLSQIKKLVSGTTRHKMLKTRIKEYGVDGVLEAMEKIKDSDFLMGKTGEGWTITFDWFIKPNNFPKVLGGNYDNKQATGSTERKQSWAELAQQLEREGR